MITGKVILKEDGSKRLEIVNLKLYERTIRQFKEGSEVNITIEKKKKESRKQRGYYFGACLTVWAYLNDLDWKDKEVIDGLHEIAKKEWNRGVMIVDDVAQVFGKSSRNGNLQPLIDGVIQHLEDEYGIKRQDCLDPEDYLYWKDVIFPSGDCDWYIQYLSKIGKLPKK